MTGGTNFVKMPRLFRLIQLRGIGPALASGAVADPDGAGMLQEAQQVVAACHAGQPPATNRRRVIYFVPKDGRPLAN